MSSQPAPRVVVIAGPNGAGKSTIADEVLRGPFRVNEFVNADVIARGLSAFAPETVAWQAGRIMLRRLEELAGQRVDFAFETTLASRTFAPWLKRLIATGYEFHLVFLWVPKPEIAFARVKDRVRRGGHSVPEETIRRRYYSGIQNFAGLYRELAFHWQVVNNTSKPATRIASGSRLASVAVEDPIAWSQFMSSTKP